MATGADIANLARTRISEKYVSVLVPKDNANWHGPWDCAEFASWLVYQTTRRLYGCIDNSIIPTLAEAYSGAWARDANSGALIAATEDEATNTAGLILIRKPPTPGKMGHVAVSDGVGKTIEAAGTSLGVREGKVRGRLWDYVVRVPEITYLSNGAILPSIALPFLLRFQSPPTKSPLVKLVQQALKATGFDPGSIDGEYGAYTLAAVGAFQASTRLIADGIVGPLTAQKLGVTWPA